MVKKLILTLIAILSLIIVITFFFFFPKKDILLEKKEAFDLSKYEDKIKNMSDIEIADFAFSKKMPELCDKILNQSIRKKCFDSLALGFLNYIKVEEVGEDFIKFEKAITFGDISRCSLINDKDYANACTIILSDIKTLDAENIKTCSIKCKDWVYYTRARMEDNYLLCEKISKEAMHPAGKNLQHRCLLLLSPNKDEVYTKEEFFDQVSLVRAIENNNLTECGKITDKTTRRQCEFLVQGFFTS